MAKKTPTETLRRKEKIKAAVDLRDVPEGTAGKVLLSNGLDWIRYWVRFDNGVEMGSIHRDKLVRLDEWDQYLADRESAAERAADAVEVGEDLTEGESEGGAEGVVVGGVEVPQLLLDRTKAALERFGVSR
jgi:hypothetical protein